MCSTRTIIYNGITGELIADLVEDKPGIFIARVVEAGGVMRDLPTPENKLLDLLRRVSLVRR
jgi:hypothetical protein